MIFIVKCAYCGKTYIVDTDKKQKSFLCPSCAGANGLKEVQERYKDKETLEIKKGKTFEEIWGEAEGLDSIKKFDAAYFPVVDDGGYSTSSDPNAWIKGLLVSAGLPILLFLCYLLCVLASDSCNAALKEREFQEKYGTYLERIREESGDEKASEYEEYLRNVYGYD